MIAHMARVSNVNATEGDPSEKLIAYLLNHKHFSPFEMACMCVEIETTRDIARQILRHRSFHFQEFSQRYAVVDEKPELFLKARLQDLKNRQNSLTTQESYPSDFFLSMQNKVWTVCWASYKACLAIGIAKELARKLLPEGLTKTRMYMQGTIRDWLHYIYLRTEPETQFEHRQIAQECSLILRQNCPQVWEAAFQALELNA